MTIPQPAPSHEPVTPYDAPAGVGGRGLASAIAVFLGGYLLLASFAGSQLVQASMNLFAFFTDGPTIGIPASVLALAVLQSMFAVVVVAAGLLLGRGPRTGRALGSALVVVGSLVTFLVFGARVSGAIRFPGGEAGLPFTMLFGNAWFAIVLIVGAAWLLSRGARRGWLSLLAALILVPLPVVFALNNIEYGVTAIVMYALSALVGVGIIAAGRPLRD